MGFAPVYLIWWAVRRGAYPGDGDERRTIIPLLGWFTLCFLIGLGGIGLLKSWLRLSDGVESPGALDHLVWIAMNVAWFILVVIGMARIARLSKESRSPDDLLLD